MNKQVIFSLKQLGISKIGEQSFIPIHGLQSAGLDTTFNLEQAFEFGQAEVYENIENIPDVQITMQKVLDGYPLMWHLATRGATTPSLQGRGSITCIAALAIFDDTKSSASGTPITLVQMSGMYPANVAYNMSVDGNFTEDMTLIGNHRAWTSTGPYVFS